MDPAQMEQLFRAHRDAERRRDFDAIIRGLDGPGAIEVTSILLRFGEGDPIATARRSNRGP